MKNPIKMIEKAQKECQPTFTLLAQDKHSIAAIKAYRKSLENDGLIGDDYKAEINIIEDAFMIWANNNPDKIKSPD